MQPIRDPVPERERVRRVCAVRLAKIVAQRNRSRIGSTDVTQQGT